MQSIRDIFQTIARQRGRGESTPLIMLRVLDEAPGERISHLPIDPQLAQAWLAYSGDPFRPHQAHALAAFRRGEPVALRSSSPGVVATLQLLARAVLAESPRATVITLAFDDEHAHALSTSFESADRSLPPHLRVSTTTTGAQQVDPFAHIVIATPEALHGRILRYHARAWGTLWNRLRLILIPDVHRYTGVAGAHLADLLMRAHRVAAAHGVAPGFLASLIDVPDPAPALTALLGNSWRVIDADDGPRMATVVAVWQGGSAWLRETVELVTALRRQSYRVHVLCDALERPMLAPVIGDAEEVTFGPEIASAQVLVCAGLPGSIGVFRRLLSSGCQAVIVVTGERPQDQALVRQVSMLLEGPPTMWPVPSANAYVLAQHVVCAASELPLSAADVDAWGCAEVVQRMAASGQLVELPDDEPLWIPSGDADPYAEFSILAASGSAITAHSEQPHIHERLDPTLFERWAFTSAALPPGVGGLRVVLRDEEEGRISLRLETGGRRTYPLRRGNVAIRNTYDERALFRDQRMFWGRVVVQETIYGWRETTSGASPADIALRAPLESRWVAPACWFQLPVALQVQGQFIGWCLTAAVTLRALASFTDLVPLYDHERQRLFFIDAQPGGNGLAQWLYQHAEDVLPIAYDVALACRSDPLLEPLSRVEQDWLLALLGRTPPEPSRRSEPAIQAPPVAPSDERRQLNALSGSPVNASQLQRERRESRISAPPPPVDETRSSARTRAPAQPPPDRQSTSEMPETPEQPQATPSGGASTDAAALIERLRRQREQRERSKNREMRTQPAPESDIEPRFTTGERIFCLPYGDGEVLESRIEAGREVLIVRFPDYGELTIDPALSLVRKLDASQGL
ncbi:MAG: helicase [Roseiflexus sp.]